MPNPSPTEATQHDLDELKHAAWKARAVASPHVLATVPVDAEKLLALIERVEERNRFMRDEQRLYDEETEKTINEQAEEIQKLRDQLAGNIAPE